MPTATDHQIYVFITSAMTAVAVTVVIRLWLLRREEAKLLRNRQALEKQILQQQNDLLKTRQENQAWRGEMQRQFDLYRHTASTQLDVEQRRFNELLAQSGQREKEWQTELALARQMCAALPHAQARVLYLEALVAQPPATSSPQASQTPPDSRTVLGPAPAPAATPPPAPELLTPAATPPAAAGQDMLPPIPALAAPQPSARAIPSPLPQSALLDLPPIPDAPALRPAQVSPGTATDRTAFQRLEQRLADAEKQNQQLLQALAAARLRSRRSRKQPVRGRLPLRRGNGHGWRKA